MPENINDMRAWRQAMAREAAASRDLPCLLVLKYGEGASETLCRLALELGAKRVALVAPMPAHELMEQGLTAAMDNLGVAGSVRRFRGRSGGGEACRTAALDVSGDMLFCVLAPNQASGAGGWCESRRESPFGLVAADCAEMYANHMSERSRGIASMAAYGPFLAGIVHDNIAMDAMADAQGAWKDARIVRLPLPDMPAGNVPACALEGGAHADA